MFVYHLVLRKRLHDDLQSVFHSLLDVLVSFLVACYSLKIAVELDHEVASDLNAITLQVCRCEIFDGKVASRHVIVVDVYGLFNAKVEITIY